MQPCAPYYHVHTPRNGRGESLVQPGGDFEPPHALRPAYEVRSLHTGTKCHAKHLDRAQAQDEADRLNRQHAKEMAYAMHI